MAPLVPKMTTELLILTIIEAVGLSRLAVNRLVAAEYDSVMRG